MSSSSGAAHPQCLKPKKHHPNKRSCGQHLQSSSSPAQTQAESPLPQQRRRLQSMRWVLTHACPGLHRSNNRALKLASPLHGRITAHIAPQGSVTIGRHRAWLCSGDRCLSWLTKSGNDSQPRTLRCCSSSLLFATAAATATDIARAVKHNSIVIPQPSTRPQQRLHTWPCTRLRKGRLADSHANSSLSHP